MQPTLLMVAQRAGVSDATVSRTLHNDPSVRPATRKKVLDACSELGYEPSIAGRRLKQGKKAVVGLSLGSHDSATTRYVSLLHQALSKQLSKSGWSVELIEADRFGEGLDLGGLILIGVLSDDPRLRQGVIRSIPTVCIGRAKDAFCVSPDDDFGAKMAIEHLVEIGRKHLAVLCMRDAAGELSQRTHAAINHAKRLDVNVEVIEASFTSSPTLQGYRAIARSSLAASSVDGLFCETDELACGAQAAFQDLNISVPNQIALTGFDDLPNIAENITTIRQDISMLASQAISLLGEARQGKAPRTELISVELIKRGTT